MTEERQGMNKPTFPSLPQPILATFLLIIASLLSLIAANTTTFAATYFNTLNYPFAGLSLLQWINEGLMTLVFLYFGLILKTLLLTHKFHQRTQHHLALLTAFISSILPSIIYLIFNGFSATTLYGWSIPIASDLILIFFLLSLLNNTIPVALKTFLLVLVITENIIALLLTSALHIPKFSWFYFILAALIYLALIIYNAMGKVQHRFYLLGGLLLWLFTLKAGIHATIVGFLLAWVLPHSLPDQITPSLVLQWQKYLKHCIAYLILPIFIFTNLGFSFADCSWETLLSPVSFGVALGFIIKPIGIFGTIWLLIKLKWSKMPEDITLWYLLSAALLCSVGFSMSIFMSTLVLPDIALQNSSKIAILFCSVGAGVIGYGTLRLAALFHKTA